MAYEKHNYASGDVLLASELNEMDGAIETHDTDIGNLKSAIGDTNFNIFRAIHSGFMEKNTRTQITEFSHSTPGYSGYTGFIPGSGSKPYYACSFGANYVEFTISIPSNYTDLWIGCELSDGAFYGGHALNANKSLRYCLNATAAVKDQDSNKVVLKAGNSYAIKAIAVGNYFMLLADGQLVQSFTVPSNYTVVGIAILNLGITSSIFSDVYVESNNQLINKGLSANIEQDGSLSHIVEPIVTSINGANWNDAPTSNNGVFICLRYAADYVIQLYFENSGTHRMSYYRIVKTTDFSEVIAWQTFVNNTVITPFKLVTDTDIINNNWTSFKDLPVNVIHCLSLTSQKMAELGFPVTRPSTFFSISPYAGANQSYKVFFVITNSASELNIAYVAFGHGTVITPWTSIDTYNGAGFKNPLASAVFNSESKIAFVGDSIVAGLGGTGYNISESGGGSYIMNHHNIERYENIAGHCWVNSFIDHIKTIYGITNVHNRGVGGINTQTILNNIATILDGANMVILSCGTNDYNNNANIYTYLPQIVKYCTQNNILIMVMTNTPNNTDDSNKYNAVQGQIQRVCNDIGIPCYDMYSEFENYRKLKGLSLSEVLSADGIHPNDIGYDIMYDCALKLFGI